MSVDQFIDTLEEEVEIIRAGDAEDIARVKQKRPANGNRLVLMIGAIIEARETHRDSIFVRELLTDDAYDLDLPRVIAITRERFGGRVAAYRDRFDLVRTAELLEDLVGLLDEITTEERFLETLKAVQVYIQFLHGYFYSQVPWHDLNITYEGRMAVDERYQNYR